MIVTEVKTTSDNTYTAVIDGIEWHNITPVSQHWHVVQSYIAGGGLVIPIPPSPYYNWNGTAWVFDLDRKKEAQKAAVSQSFNETLANGFVQSSLGFPVDARRSATKDDLQNMESLLSRLQRTGEASTTVKDANGVFHVVTQAQLQTIVAELQDYGLALYQRKFQREVAIDSVNIADPVQAEAAINAITW